MKVFLQLVWMRIPNSIAAKARDMGPKVPPVPVPDPQGRRRQTQLGASGCRGGSYAQSSAVSGCDTLTESRPAGKIPELRALVSTDSPWDHVCLGEALRRERAGMVASKWAHNEEERPQWGQGPLGATFLFPSLPGNGDGDSMDGAAPLHHPRVPSKAARRSSKAGKRCDTSELPPDSVGCP